MTFKPMTFRWWFVVIGAVVFTVAGVVVTPSALREISETRQLHDHGLHAVGRVVGHTPALKKCRSKASIQYEVNGVRHLVQVQGCGAHPNNALIGAVADVVYLPENPSVATAELPAASTSRTNPLGLFFLWVAGPVAGAFAWFRAC